MSNSLCVMKVDITVDINDSFKGALQIAKLVKPNWNDKDISYKVFDNGITNKMYGFYYCDDIITMILVRVNGIGTELFLQRNKEVESFELLHKHGCAPALYCVFNNGLCYEFIQGKTITKELVKSEVVYNLLTSELAKVHSIPFVGDAPPEPKLFNQIQGFFDIIFPSSSKESREEERVLRREVNEMETCLKQLNSPVVFCHNDILLHNVIYNSKTDVVKFIDYEYAGYNYQAYDIGNHFCEFAGIDEVDYSLYPDKEFQFRWLRSYLTAWHARNSKENSPPDMEKEITELYRQVNKFALASHLFWGIWALVQAKYSSIDFDYKEYSNLRLSEYYKRKEEFLSL